MAKALEFSTIASIMHSWPRASQAALCTRRCPRGECARSAKFAAVLASESSLPWQCTASLARPACRTDRRKPAAGGGTLSPDGRRLPPHVHERLNGRRPRFVDCRLNVLEDLPLLLPRLVERLDEPALLLPHATHLLRVLLRPPHLFLLARSRALLQVLQKQLLLLLPALTRRLLLLPNHIAAEGGRVVLCAARACDGDGILLVGALGLARLLRPGQVL
mmetsp:Transcript_14803/g.41411  ORF Transcript_14803/g.41411 Transcript_14803/m.41411 type:complete len:219 (+) Transcript_14803:501-1157(+)